MRPKTVERIVGPVKRQSNGFYVVINGCLTVYVAFVGVLSGRDNEVSER